MVATGRWGSALAPLALRPELDVELAADTFHRILLGELSLLKALGSGLLKVKGPIWKTNALGELFQQGKSCYPSILREHKLAQ